jgi:hypothetical protein
MKTKTEKRDEARARRFAATTPEGRERRVQQLTENGWHCKKYPRVEPEDNWTPKANA